MEITEKMIEAGANAAAEEFKRRVSGTAGIPFAQTGVTLPVDDIWLGYSKAVLSAVLSPAPVSAEPQPVDATVYNAAFDPADDAFGGAFKDGFREGWLFASDPGFDNREELEADYHHIVDIAPSECWDAYRDKYFAMLPLAAIPTVGEVAASPPDLAAENARLLEAAKAVIAAEKSWRECMPKDWEGDPLTDAIADLSAALADQKGGQ